MELTSPEPAAFQWTCAGRGLQVAHVICLLVVSSAPGVNMAPVRKQKRLHMCSQLQKPAIRHGDCVHSMGLESQHVVSL